MKAYDGLRFHGFFLFKRKKEQTFLKNIEISEKSQKAIDFLKLK